MRYACCARRLLGNRDDGVDLNGDTQAILYRNQFFNNKDDGVELRLGRLTYAVLVKNTFEGHEEDGIELIDGPSVGSRNVVIIDQNVFQDCGRYGVGAVSRGTEESSRQPVHARIWGGGNRFTDSGREPFSSNLIAVDLARQEPVEPVTIQLRRSNEKSEQRIPLRFPVPLAVYRIAGPKDAEAIVLQPGPWGLWAWIADDRSGGALWKIDLSRSRTLQRFAMAELFDQGTVRHPEGLAMVQGPHGPRILLSDDDARLIAALDINGDQLEPAETFSTVPWHDMPEDLEVVNDTLYVTGNELTAVDLKTHLVRAGFPIRYRLRGYGSRLPGLGYDGLSLLATAISSDELNSGVLLRIDPLSAEVRGIWYLGHYVRDPRGVTSYNGLVYVVDGTPPAIQYRVWCFALAPIEDLTPLTKELLFGRSF